MKGGLDPRQPVPLYRWRGCLSVVPSQLKEGKFPSARVSLWAWLWDRSDQLFGGCYGLEKFLPEQLSVRGNLFPGLWQNDQRSHWRTCGVIWESDQEAFVEYWHQMDFWVSSPVSLLHCGLSWPGKLGRCFLTALSTEKQNYLMHSLWSFHSPEVLELW